MPPLALPEVADAKSENTPIPVPEEAAEAPVPPTNIPSANALNASETGMALKPGIIPDLPPIGERGQAFVPLPEPVNGVDSSRPAPAIALPEPSNGGINLPATVTGLPAPAPATGTPAATGTSAVTAPAAPGLFIARKSMLPEGVKTWQVPLKQAIVPPKTNFNFRRQILPREIYAASYDRANTHLPLRREQEQYDYWLFLAASANDINATRALLNYGRNPNQTNTEGDTLLIVAVRHKAFDTARLLIARGANPNAAGIGGHTAMDYARALGAEEILTDFRKTPQS
jgi:hypothetical protein